MDLATEHGAGPLVGDMVSEAVTGACKGGEKIMLIRLKQPFRYEGSGRRYVAAATCYEGDDLLDLVREKAIDCNLTWVQELQAQSAAQLDLTAWRGGLGLVGR